MGPESATKILRLEFKPTLRARNSIEETNTVHFIIERKRLLSEKLA
jgi:hypothetical protein